MTLILVCVVAWAISFAGGFVLDCRRRRGERWGVLPFALLATSIGMIALSAVYL